MTAVHFVVPEGIDDPDRPSGGNAYDRHISRILDSSGFSVHVHPAPGPWPRPDSEALGALARVAQELPDGSVALIDGLVASAAPEVLVPLAGRLRLVVLVHMPLGQRPPNGEAETIRTRECAVLRAAAAVITTSQWSRRRLLALYRLAPDRLHIAEPGVDRAGLATGTRHGGELLCVAAVTFDKGHDVLVEALLSMPELPWRCLCVGSVERDPAFVEELRGRTHNGALGDRVSFPGPRTGSELDASYDAADLMVLASRAETYGMVVTEALARGVPVVAADVGGLTEALGHGADGVRPGLLVAPGDPAALAAAIRAWLGDPALRGRWRRAAQERRQSLSGWPRTASVIANVLIEASNGR
ncbi:MAG TPA: glycosyltransferase family 4 protein [Nocardioides sp.]|nr:glycosyltransferase family 4 protein [Nocardioides sp.]